ncbi:hypothetical protein [Streptomyces sp. NPDC005244]|uniref:hypothetical protein n=1 Tax=Streptomyces sp. NPDC005244 TaxID=3364708 RepID=UPI00368D216D
MSEICRWCVRSTDSPVKVGLDHVASTGGHEVFACPACRFLWGLLPYDEHPADSDGRVLYDGSDLPFA